MNTNLLTIIIPLYNNGNYIERCILSVINQSYKNIEIVVVDDCSTDNSFDSVISIQRNHKNINYIKLNKNLGPGGARNKGMKYAHGKYITFLDSDDWIDGYAYEKMIASMEKSNSDISICGVKNENDDSFSSEVRHYYKYDNIIDANWGLKMLTKEYNTDTIISSLLGNKIFLRESNFNEISFISKNYYEDDVYSFLKIMNASKISLVSEVYYHYYQRKSSITHQINKRYFKDFVVAFSFLRKKIINENKFIILENEFYSFFNKCLSFLLYMLQQNEQSDVIQREYLYYFYEQCVRKLGFKLFLDHIDTKRLLNLYPYSTCHKI